LTSPFLANTNYPSSTGPSHAIRTHRSRSLHPRLRTGNPHHAEFLIELQILALRGPVESQWKAICLTTSAAWAISVGAALMPRLGAEHLSA